MAELKRDRDDTASGGAAAPDASQALAPLGSPGYLRSAPRARIGVRLALYKIPEYAMKSSYKCTECKCRTHRGNPVAGWVIVPGVGWNKVTRKREGLVAEARYVCAQCW
ncbi:hypothetical protein HYH02_004386 [Chlamydomonas schloesseri]|uniref:Uncharacterized protein n=1 Tax=Chlamydomonas schloesseri TaxID=2026947 RepID=A0A836B912_9CHLO|nr:hypothetical protein HYH02_004386 [Chlamydomonas schloesseri]|eukprot:KAG2451118.1 hypothetical protein HYH02_004386 [Chlamydomonas schloesseri]